MREEKSESRRGCKAPMALWSEWKCQRPEVKGHLGRVTQEKKAGTDHIQS